MKPHRLSDLLSDLYRRINPAYGPGRQKGEFAEALAAVGIRPEHGNRGEELEALVLVDAKELDQLRAGINDLERYIPLIQRAKDEIVRLRSAPVAVEVPSLTKQQIAMAEACCDEDDYPPFEEWALNGKLGDLADIVATLYKARSNAIDSSRILKDGERAVPVELLDRIEAKLDMIGFSKETDRMVDQIRAILRSGEAWKEDLHA